MRQTRTTALPARASLKPGFLLFRPSYVRFDEFHGEVNLTFLTTTRGLVRCELN